MSEVLRKNTAQRMVMGRPCLCARRDASGKLVGLKLLPQLSQVGQQIVSRPVPGLAVLLKGPFNDPNQRIRRIRQKLAKRPRFLADYGRDGVRHAAAGEWRPAGDHFEEDDAEAENIGSQVQGYPAR